MPGNRYLYPGVFQPGRSIPACEGPLYDFSFQSNVINREVWNSIPADLQQIILEEAAKSELEALRLAAAQNQVGDILSQLEFVPFPDEILHHSFHKG